ncbi:hypothetical protein ABNM11_20980 [Pseudomonas syringae]
MNTQELTDEELDALEAKAKLALMEMVSTLGESSAVVRVYAVKTGSVVRELLNCSIFTPEHGFPFFVRLKSDDGRWLELTPDNDTEKAGVFGMFKDDTGEVGRVLSGVEVETEDGGWIMQNMKVRIKISSMNKD